MSYVTGKVRQNLKLVAYSDSDWAADINDTTGYCFSLDGPLIRGSPKSKQQLPNQHVRLNTWHWLQPRRRASI